MSLAVIGGTGMETGAGEATIQEVATPFGPVLLSRREELFFLGRHGSEHRLPPHKINYRANIWALKKAGVEAVIATFAVGSLKKSLDVGSLVVVDDFLDFTTARPKTFFDREVRHTDMTRPYAPRVREAILAAGKALGIALIDGGCYVATDGPRYETPAEVRMFAALGGDVVGMTGLPEAVLAKELGLDYGALAMVTNLGAGLGGELSHAEVTLQVAQSKRKVDMLLQASLQRLL